MRTSVHAAKRMRQRGIKREFMGRLLDNADIERSIGGNCRLYRVSRSLARQLRDERLSHYVAIISDDTGNLVTVFPDHGNRAAARYRVRH